jgi:hypothetical protein
MKLELCQQIFAKAQVSVLIKTLPLGAEFSHAEGRANRQTDRQAGRHTKIIVAISSFAKRA